MIPDVAKKLFLTKSQAAGNVICIYLILAVE